MRDAEGLGIGPASLRAMGGIVVRQCHSNTGPVVVCTQDESRRAKFEGTPERLVNLFSFIAEEVREILAGLGVRSLRDVIGRTDLLAQVSRGDPSLDDLDLNPILVRADAGGFPAYDTIEGRHEVPETLDAPFIQDAKPVFELGEKMQFTDKIAHTQRPIRTKLTQKKLVKGKRRSLRLDLAGGRLITKQKTITN